MIDKKNFNLIVAILENNLFFKKKKNIRFINKLIMYYKHKKILVNNYYKLGHYWNFFIRFESLFGFLPKVISIKTRRKGKTKKIIFLRSVWVFKAFLDREKRIFQVINYIFNFHNYLYLKYILNKKLKIIKYEEVFKHFIKKWILVQHNSLSFNINLYFKWLDFNRKFVNAKEITLRTFKSKKFFYLTPKRLRYYNSKILINSFYCKYFLLPLKILSKNYRKLIIFLFKKYRKRRKNNEKTYILL